MTEEHGEPQEEYTFAAAASLSASVSFLPKVSTSWSCTSRSDTVCICTMQKSSYIRVQYMLNSLIGQLSTLQCHLLTCA